MRLAPSGGTAPISWSISDRADAFPTSPSRPLRQPLAPVARSSAQMGDRRDEQHVAADDVVHGKREATQEEAAAALSGRVDRPAIGCLSNNLNRTLNSGKQLVTEP